MKILWHSVAPWVGTGYGMQTGQATPRISKLGHDVAISAYYGLAGTMLEWQGMKVYPQFAENYGTDVVVPHALHHFGCKNGDDFRRFAASGWVISLTDVWVLQAPLLPDVSAAAWVPIDHETIPPVVRDWFDWSNAVPIAMSKFGRDKLIESGLEHTLYVPHAIDTSIFRPGDREAARERAGLPQDAFIVAIVAANFGKDVGRKAFHEQIMAFTELYQQHPDAHLALHTNVTSPKHGMDIQRLLRDMGLPKTAYTISDQYQLRIGVPQDDVADVYRSADVLSNTSWGEGFGVPIVEAQACGTPVIVTNTTAMPELCGSGWAIEGEPWWHEPQQAWARRPLIGNIIEAYHEAYDKARDPDMREKAYRFALDYDADLVAETHWRPTLDKMEAALEQRAAELSAPVERKMRTQLHQSDDGFLWIDRGRKSGDIVGFANHEPEMWKIFEETLPEGGVLLDVGAHVGHYAVRLAGRASHIYAVEANPETARTLRKNLALNDITNVDVLEFAAWDRDEMLMLDDPLHQVAGGSTRTVNVSMRSVLAEKTQVVRAQRLDHCDALRGVERIDVVKLDVEGADLHVLRGLRGLVDKFHPTLLIECHDCYGYYDRADLEATIRELGYGFEVVQSLPTQWMPEGMTEEIRQADYLRCTPILTEDLAAKYGDDVMGYVKARYGEVFNVEQANPGRPPRGYGEE